MKLKDRTKTILETSVRDFIKHGKPITSEYLYESYDFGIKPAMIRWELNDLNEQGYFYQARPSGGRFPSDKAYRFFVDELITSELPKLLLKETELITEGLIRGKRDKAVSEVARHLKLLGVGYEPATEELYESGLRALLERLEIEEKEELLQVVKDFEHLGSRLGEASDWWHRETEWPQVFVGESPITESKNISLIADRFYIGKKPFLLIAIGPKRMDYEKSIGIFKLLEESLI